MVLLLKYLGAFRTYFLLAGLKPPEFTTTFAAFTFVVAPRFAASCFMAEHTVDNAWATIVATGCFEIDFLTVVVMVSIHDTPK